MDIGHEETVVLFKLVRDSPRALEGVKSVDLQLVDTNGFYVTVAQVQVADFGHANQTLSTRITHLVQKIFSSPMSPDCKTSRAIQAGLSD